MTFEPVIGIGAIIEIALTFTAIIGGWFTLKGAVKATVEKLSDLRKRVDDDKEKTKSDTKNGCNRMASGPRVRKGR